jgi:hypothetical protein
LITHFGRFAAAAAYADPFSSSLLMNSRQVRPPPLMNMFLHAISHCMAISWLMHTAASQPH